MTKNDFYENWMKSFCIGISESTLRRFVKTKGNFIWHIFSWKLIPANRYLSGKKAEKAFNEVSKRGAWYIDWFTDDHAHQIITELKDAESLSQFVEVYVVGKDFQWTYIKTHEDGFGPYFMKR